jgi:hypothetical protein
MTDRCKTICLGHNPLFSRANGQMDRLTPIEKIWLQIACPVSIESMGYGKFRPIQKVSDPPLSVRLTLVPYKSME